MADQLLTGTTLVEKESRSVGDIPVGAITAWLKSFAGVPNLPENYRECDGSVIVDALSAMNGQTLPDLNGGEFLEGRATSGATGGSATMAHTHGLTGAEAQIGFASGTNKISAKFATTASYTPDNEATNLTVTATGTATTLGVGLAGPTDAASNAENRPPFYTVVWVMRIR